MDWLAALGAVPRRLLTYSGFGLGLTFLGMQIAPPRIPAASAAAPDTEVAQLLPALPVAVQEPLAPMAGAALFELTLPFPADGDLAALLVEAGASTQEASRAASLLADAVGGKIDMGSDLKLALGDARPGAHKPIERLTLLSDLGHASVIREQGVLTLRRASGSTRHVVADLSTGPYWALRGAGLDARLALEAAGLVEKQAGGFRRVTAVTGERPDRFGSKSTPQLLFLALERTGRPPLRLLKWPGTEGGWIDVDRFASQTALATPVTGRVSSPFGLRVHPVLRFLRPHQGVDYAARWGTPVRAAADGQVVMAGWRGGYGRRVELSHAKGLATTYSHLSDMVVAPGSRVRRGDLIGFVGASGLATGPHLHFEVTRFGTRIDPLRARLLDSGSAGDRSAVAARLAQLNIGKGA